MALYIADLPAGERWRGVAVVAVTYVFVSVAVWAVVAPAIRAADEAGAAAPPATALVVVSAGVVPIIAGVLSGLAVLSVLAVASGLVQGIALYNVRNPP